MSSSTVQGPFHGDLVEEVHLNSAPLIRVLAQVRWPELTELKNQFEQISDSFAKEMQSDYPLSAHKVGTNFTITPEGVSQTKGDSILRLATPDEDWVVFLSPTFLTLETSDYDTREFFLRRFGSVLSGLLKHASIPKATRVGFRFVNRIDSEEDLLDLKELVQPQLLGGRNIPGIESVDVRHSLTEVLYDASEANLLAKWAVLPAGATIDPTIEPSLSQCWMLDLDAFTDDRLDFDPDLLVERARRLATMGHTFFRWAVTQKFLDRYRDAR
jgi:uncharacterized protein (TIGR04255 family)